MGEEHKEEDELQEAVPISGMYEDWFLDYASYVILERAVPAVSDGLKPVQRRILHALQSMDDGRFHKVANVIGSTMQYHPHGDASIGDAMVNLGQKDLLIETQGNWGDVRTGDSAAAARYIEARLSKFALEVVFNSQTTEWQLSYDGRKKEPVTFPVKFPLLLAQGVEGIAVGLSTKVLPHNFCELLQACISILKGKKPKLYPDFQTGGKVDVTDYNDGRRGGRIRVRATIEEVDSKTLAIKDIPFGTTTTSVIDSIIKANEKGKIKIKQVVDNTARDVEIQIQLAPGTSPDITMDALYAFTDCEVSVSPNACVIMDDKPHFLSVSDILSQSVEQTVYLLKRELEIRRNELKEKLLFSSLEKIFIENRIYRDIEECETWEAVILTIDKGLESFKQEFYRGITEEDITRLTEIKIKRISKFDSFKADEAMRRMDEELNDTEHHLQHLTDYAIDYYQQLLNKYGKSRERKTEITSFESIQAHAVAANNARLYVNRKDGFIGYGLKKDEFLVDCSDIDDIIVFRRDGKCLVTKIQDKVFVGKDILHASVFNKGDERMVYNMVYMDGKSGRSMGKRFQVLSVTRDREYDLTKEAKGSKVLYFSANPNGEAEQITVYLTSASKARKKVFDFDFADMEIKGRGAGGNILTRYAVRKIDYKSAGRSTLGGVNIWYDATVGRLNREERGDFVGTFNTGDQVAVFHRDGTYVITSFELTNHYDFELVIGLYKWFPGRPFNAIHYDGETKTFLVKRFLIETTSLNKRFRITSEARNSRLIFISHGLQTQVRMIFREGKKHLNETLDLQEIVDVKGWKAMGNKSPIQSIVKVEALESPNMSIKEDQADEWTGSEKQEVEDEDQLGLFGNANQEE